MSCKPKTDYTTITIEKKILPILHDEQIYKRTKNMTQLILYLLDHQK